MKVTMSPAGGTFQAGASGCRGPEGRQGEGFHPCSYAPWASGRSLGLILSELGSSEGLQKGVTFKKAWTAEAEWRQQGQ